MRKLGPRVSTVNFFIFHIFSEHGFLEPRSWKTSIKQGSRVLQVPKESGGSIKQKSGNLRWKLKERATAKRRFRWDLSRKYHVHTNYQRRVKYYTDASVKRRPFGKRFNRAEIIPTVASPTLCNFSTRGIYTLQTRLTSETFLAHFWQLDSTKLGINTQLRAHQTHFAASNVPIPRSIHRGEIIEVSRPTSPVESSSISNAATPLASRIELRWFFRERE